MSPTVSQTVLFLLKLTLKLHIKCYIYTRVSSQRGKWDDVLQGETPIAAEMLLILPQMNMEDGMSF